MTPDSWTTTDSHTPLNWDDRTAAAASLEKFTVLLVEDEQSARQAMHQLLQHYNYTVDTAASVSQGLKRLQEQTPQLVVLDLMLPDGNGLTILQKIRDLKLPCEVIVVTAETTSDLLRRVTALRPLAIYLKPLNFIELLERIRELDEARRSAVHPQCL
jgi:DNA-binding response OmpR family regulator